MDATEEADACRYVKIHLICVIPVPRRDGGAGSYAIAGIAKLCDLCVLCGEISPDSIAKIGFINVP
jgi:hypothetical protein